MEQAIHSLIELVDEGNLPSLREALCRHMQSWGQEVFQVLPGEVSVLNAAISGLREHGPSLACFLVEHGAADALPPRRVNALYHRIYALLAASEEDACVQTTTQLLERMWALGVGKQMQGQCWTPAHMAAAQEHPTRAVAQLERLREHGFEIDLADEVGETPLFVAAWKSRLPVVEYLLEAGASLEKRTRSGKDVVAYVFERRCGPEEVQDIIEMLQALQTRGYPVEASMATCRVYKPEAQAQIEEAIMQHKAPVVAHKRNGPRL